MTSLSLDFLANLALKGEYQADLLATLLALAVLLFRLFSLGKMSGFVGNLFHPLNTLTKYGSSFSFSQTMLNSQEDTALLCLFSRLKNVQNGCPNIILLVLSNK